MTTSAVFAPDETRQLVEDSLPADVSAHGRAPEPRNLYVPLRHSQALSPDHGLVVGIRGAGKSVWWAALQSESHRRVVVASIQSLSLQEISRVSAGFGEENRPDDYPDKRVLRKLLHEGAAITEIWRTVIAWHTWGKSGELADCDTWARRVHWLEAHPEEAARAFKRYDDQLAGRGLKHLILFDALDRSSDVWKELRQLLQGLLRISLEFRSSKSIRAKIFVRPDMLDDPVVTSFQDASKVVAAKVELRWARADLYGLLFQRLGNSPSSGRSFRSGCEDIGGGRWLQTDGIWQVPKALREDEDLQRKVFDQIAGKWMGRDRRRGFPYTWLPSHLADAAEQVSPRSFLAAVRTAAEDSRSYRGEYALHYEAIKRGVQEASRIRVKEVEEDFPWLASLMEPLSGLVIPCSFDEVATRWEATHVLDILKRMGKQDGILLPKHIDQGLGGLRTDLLDLALFSKQKDGRINMPDVYRVGFGLGRRGGVKPIR